MTRCAVKVKYHNNLLTLCDCAKYTKTHIIICAKYLDFLGISGIIEPTKHERRQKDVRLQRTQKDGRRTYGRNQKRKVFLIQETCKDL